jgi:hypothetical protein
MKYAFAWRLQIQKYLETRRVLLHFFNVISTSFTFSFMFYFSEKH